jgi:hypothetical protein
MYVTGWDYRSGLPKSVLQITDSDLPNAYLLNTILYPNESKMMIRVRTASTRAKPGTDYTVKADSDAVISGGSTMLRRTSALAAPVCDIQEIDLQRWINILVVINNRVCDVYYDGKLSRSCVLPDLPEAGSPGSGQVVLVGQNGGFSGKFAAIQFFAYALTPDRIYSIYQRGPSGGQNWVKALTQTLGIRNSYTASPQTE